MLLPFQGLLCLWLCSEAVATQLRWHKSAEFSPQHESAAAGTGTHNRRWRTIGEADSGGRSGESARNSGLEAAVDPSSAGEAETGARKSDAQNGTLRTEEIQPGDAGRRECSPGEESTKTPHGHTCTPGRTRVSHRQRRSDTRRGAATQWEAPPAAMAQEQEAAAPSAVNASDYEEEYVVPDLTDTTPFVPVDTGTRRKPVKNPFYPVTADTYGAYAVLITAAVIFTVGVIGNVSVMCIVCHNYYMRSISNSLLANMALWDFVIIFFCLPLVLFHALTHDWLLGEFSCRIIPYLEVRA